MFVVWSKFYVNKKIVKNAWRNKYFRNNILESLKVKYFQCSNFSEILYNKMKKIVLLDITQLLCLYHDTFDFKCFAEDIN